MGVYPNVTKTHERRFDDGSQSWVERWNEPGVVYERTLIAAPWREVERTDCYCCSCGDIGLGDPHCRNHGWVGRRPCEKHNLPGVTGEDDVMPASVQAERARRDPQEKQP